MLSTSHTRFHQPFLSDPFLTGQAEKYLSSEVRPELTEPYGADIWIGGEESEDL